MRRHQPAGRVTDEVEQEGCSTARPLRITAPRAASAVSRLGRSQLKYETAARRAEASDWLAYEHSAKSALRPMIGFANSPTMQTPDTALLPASMPPEASEASAHAEEVKATVKMEKRRGLHDSSEQLKVLAEKWPIIFAAKPHEVRPLASSVLSAVIAEMGWTRAYGRSVFRAWKSRTSYCRAILSYDRRINLDGSLSEEGIDDQSREMARKDLERRAARMAQQSRPPYKNPENAKPVPVAAAPNEPPKPHTGKLKLDSSLSNELIADKARQLAREHVARGAVRVAQQPPPLHKKPGKTKPAPIAAAPKEPPKPPTEKSKGQTGRAAAQLAAVMDQYMGRKRIASSVK